MNKRSLMGWLEKIWQLISAATCYLLFSTGAFIIGVFFTIISPLPIMSTKAKQVTIRWTIHKGCLSFIRIMHVMGLIRYKHHFDMLIDRREQNENDASSQYGHIIVANHPTLIDAVMLFAVEKNLCCFVKGALYNNFIVGAVTRLAGYIPNHTTEAVEMAVSKLHRGESLLIFPEGTRTTDENNLQFKRGAANIAVASQAPIRPIWIDCNPPALKKGVKWYHMPDGGANFALYSAPLITLEQCIDTSKAKPLQYRAFTQFLAQFYQHWLATGSPMSPSEISGLTNEQNKEQALKEA